MYEDLGVSGAVERRPGLDALWRDAHAAAFDTVVVWKFDRVSRSTMHLLEAMQAFRSLSIDFVSLTEGVDTTTPAGRLVFTVIAGLAQFERDVTIERIRAGIAAYREAGKPWGRQGSVIDLEVLRTLANTGTPIRQIARELGVPRTTVRRLLVKLRDEGGRRDDMTESPPTARPYFNGPIVDGLLPLFPRRDQLPRTE